jgi:hypothetical protein
VNIREIEKLHAQYAPQPVVVDLTGQVAAMPALAAPGSNDRPRPSFGWPSPRFSKPVAIVAAAAALALGGGMSAARLWQAVGHTRTAPAATVAQSSIASPPTRVATPVDAAPINAAPARPLSASDFAVTGELRNGMENVDPHELLRQAAQPVEPARVVSAPASQQAASDEARAIASPIHAARHEPVQAAQSMTPTPIPQAAGPVQKPQPVAEPVAVERTQAEAAPAAPAPATHHLHRVVAHTSAVNAAKAEAPPQTDHDKPVVPGKSGDVQLF